MLADWAVEYVKVIVNQVFDWFFHMMNSIGAWFLFLGVFAMAMFVLLILMPLRGNGFSDKALPAIGLSSSGGSKQAKSDQAKRISSSNQKALPPGKGD